MCRHIRFNFIVQIAVWIDEILSESDDRMLMMDFDEDEGKFILVNKTLVTSFPAIDVK